MKRGNVCTCVFKSAELGDLAVPERVDVCPLMLDRAARRLADTTLDTHDDDGVALGDELARLELLKFEGFPDQGKELRHTLAPSASSGKGDHGGGSKGPFHVVGKEVERRRDIPAPERPVESPYYIYIR